jgi:hypothetical protein
MNDQELREQLLRATEPRWDDGYWEAFPPQVMSKIKTREAQQVPGKALRVESQPTTTDSLGALLDPLRGALGWKLLSLGLCLVICLLIILKPGRGIERTQAMEVGKYLAEFERVFPNQLAAIVFERGAVRVMLAEHPDVPPAQPLYVELCGADDCLRFVTFSGQQIQINGEPFDVLLDRQGKVLVVGKQTVWSSSSAAHVLGHYRIAARPLPSIL